MLMSVCPSIRLSHPWVAPKRFKISIYFSHHTIELCFQFSAPEFVVLNLGLHPERVRYKEALRVDIENQILHDILKTVWDGMCQVTYYYSLIYFFSLSVDKRSEKLARCLDGVMSDHCFTTKLVMLRLDADSPSLISWRPRPAWLGLWRCDRDLTRYSQRLASLVSLQASEGGRGNLADSVCC